MFSAGVASLAHALETAATAAFKSEVTTMSNMCSSLRELATKRKTKTKEIHCNCNEFRLPTATPKTMPSHCPAPHWHARQSTSQRSAHYCPLCLKLLEPGGRTKFGKCGARRVEERRRFLSTSLSYKPGTP